MSPRRSPPRSVCGTHVAAHFPKWALTFHRGYPGSRPDAGSNARAGAHFRFWSPVNFGQNSLGTTSQKRGIFGGLRPSQVLAHVIRGVLRPPEGTALGSTPGILVRPGECPILVKNGHSDVIAHAASRSYSSHGRDGCGMQCRFGRARMPPRGEGSPRSQRRSRDVIQCLPNPHGMQPPADGHRGRSGLRALVVRLRTS